MAIGINDIGQAVGTSTTAANGFEQAVIWNGTNPTVLNSLGGPSWASSINNSGQVVGTSYTAGNSQRRGVIWDGTTVIDINTLLASGPSGLVIASLIGINSGGQIVGYGFDILGNAVAVLLNPVSQTPLPAALPLLASGLGVLWIVVRGGSRTGRTS